MEHNFGKLASPMAIFNSYVKLPEGAVLGDVFAFPIRTLPVAKSIGDHGGKKKVGGPKQRHVLFGSLRWANSE